MTPTRWLVVAGTACNALVAVLAFRSGNPTAGWVLAGASLLWPAWAFWRDRG